MVFPKVFMQKISLDNVLELPICTLYDESHYNSGDMGLSRRIIEIDVDGVHGEKVDWDKRLANGRLR